MTNGTRAPKSISDKLADLPSLKNKGGRPVKTLNDRLLEAVYPNGSLIPVREFDVVAEWLAVGQMLHDARVTSV